MEMYHTMSKKIEDEWYYWIPVSGPSANIPLHEIAKSELASMSKKEVNTTLLADPRRNHLNEENNHTLANIIVDIIKNNKFLPETIRMEDYFHHIDLSNVERVRA